MFYVHLLILYEKEYPTMTLSDQLIHHQETLAITGLGYVGIVLAVAFAKHLKVIGYDINEDKVQAYKKGIDCTNEVGTQALLETTLHFTCDASLLDQAKFHIIAVPTPIHSDHTPNLTPLMEATKTVGQHLTPGSIVVYESTVYPGVTESLCIPLLESCSHLTCGRDFHVGYSPERVNPGDAIHTLDKIIKIISATDDAVREEISQVYQLVIKSGVYLAPNIQTAEAAKIIENTQRDVNIAFMNEMAMIFDKIGLDTLEVLEAASTKWNFLNFFPGLVGGHCIGIDPYYISYQAQQLGYEPQLILSSRTINDRIATYIASKTVKLLIQNNQLVKSSKVALLGITFKENCPDIRNSKVLDLIQELESYGIIVSVCDPVAHADEVSQAYQISLTASDELSEMDAVIIAVGHDCFHALDLGQLKHLYKQDLTQPILIDVKGVFNKADALAHQYTYWRL